MQVQVAGYILNSLLFFFLIPLNSLHNVTVHPLSDSATTSSFPLLRDHAPPPQCGVAWSKYHNEPWLLLPWRRNQSEAQIGAVVVFRTLHHCGREAKHDTAVSTRPLRRRNGTYQLILLSCGLGFYFLCILLVLSFFGFFFSSLSSGHLEPDTPQNSRLGGRRL